MPIDLLSEENNERQPMDLLASETEGREEGGLSLIQGRDPSMLDRVFDLFSDPVKERARAVNALVDAEALNIRPSVAYDQKPAIDKFYNIAPENKKRREKVHADIRRFNDLGGVEDEWQKVLWNNAKAVPFQMQIAAGGVMKFLEENIDPELAMNSLGAIPSEKDLETFRLAAEAREKKQIRGLSDDVILSGSKRVSELQPVVMPGSFKDTVGMAEQSTLNNLIYLAPGMWLGRAVPLVGMGTQAFGQSYIEQREGGSGKGTATAAALVKAASEVGTEFIPVGIYLKPRASFVRSLAAAELSEIPTETVNQIVNDVVDKVTIRPDMTAEEAIANIMTTVQVTALSTPGISGVTYSAHKALGKLAAKDTKLADTFNEAKNAALMAGETPQKAMQAGIEAVKATPEGAAFVKQKLDEIRKEAQSIEKPKSEQPFIFGVNEDANGEVTGFTMADPVTGQTFDVPALKSEEKEKMTVTPDMQAVNERIKELRAVDQEDAALDKLIQGDEDINQYSLKFFVDNAVLTEEGNGNIINPEVNEDGQTGQTQNATEDRSGLDAGRLGKNRAANIQAIRSRQESAGNVWTDSDQALVDRVFGDNVTGYLSHATYKESIPGILKEGLDPQKSGNYHYTDNMGKRVFLADNQDFAKDFGNVLLRVKTDSLDAGQMKLVERTAGVEINYFDKIPPDKFEIYVNGHWLNLKKWADDVMATKKESIIDRAKSINDKIGEKGSIDIAPLVDLGRSIWAEGHQSIEAFTARAKELLADVWDKVKDMIRQAWDTLNNERGSFSTKKKYDVDEVNGLLDMAARQDKALEVGESPSYNEVREKAAQMAFEKLQKKIDFKERKEAAALKRQGKADARQLPVFQAMEYISKNGGLNKSKLLKDYDVESIKEMAKRRINLVKDKGALELDVVADQMGFESADDLFNAIMDWQGLEEEGKRASVDFMGKFGDLITTAEMDNFNELLMAEEEKIMNQLTAENRPKPAKGLKTFIRQQTGQTKPQDKMVTEYAALAEAFRKEAQIARQAFTAGKKGEIEKSKEKMRWLMKRRESIKNVRDYFNLTDAEIMSVTNRKNPGLMDDAEFAQFLKDVETKAVLLADNKQAKIELMMLVESKRLQKVDNYRSAMELPTIDKMTTEQLREFAKLLEPFQDDDIFLTQRELETVDRTDLKGIKTIREAKERLAKEAGVDVEELNKVHVAALDQFRFDSSLRERDPFFDILVTRMTEASLGAELRAHSIESQAYELAKKADKSRERGIIERMVPQDDLIMAFLEAPADRKNAISEQMTPEQIDYAHFMQQYFADALNYLIATKSLERGRENYFVHIRRSFLENLKDGGLKKAFSEMFKTYQQDQMVFNILDDDTGNILPLEKFFQFSLQRTDVMDPTRNVTKAFLTYMRTFEKKKMFDAIIPKLDIYAQALTPTRYTPRGLEIDRSLKTFVNKWINNKKGRRLSFDSTLRQGGPIDVGIRALRSFTTILDLGLSPIAQTAAILGEQVTNATMLGTRGMATGTARMTTDKGKRIIEKYRSFVGRSLWEELAAPGKEITERLSETLFAGFHVSSVLANKQFLLASMSEQEFNAEEISAERLAEMRLDMGRFRVVPGTGSLVGSTSVGDAVMQYKKWAVPLARTLITDGQTLLGNIKEGKPLDDRAKKELIRFAYLTGAVFIVGAMAGADDNEDKSYIGKAKARMYREAMTLTQGMNPLLFIGVPRTWTWVVDTVKALKDMVLLEEYKTKDELKGPQELKRQFVPGVVRGLYKNNDN